MSGRELPPECARLCGTLRELRAGTGLSLAALAATTPYSKSSWERYLNGRTMPPRHAVEQLCTLAGVDPQRPLALWALAETTWSGRDGREAPSTAKDAPPVPVAVPADASAQGSGPRPRVGRLQAVILGLIAVFAVFTATLAAYSRSDPSTPEGRPVEESVSTAVVSAPGPGCHAASCTGRDPEDLECSTFADPPTTLAEQRLDGTVVKIRHSAVCDTVWARVDRATKGDLVEVLAPGVRTQQAVVKDRFDEMSSLSTPMAAASGDALDKVRACLVRKGARHCFTATPG